MKRILNQLIQLQDLNYTLAEQRALLSDTSLFELEEAIKALSKDLPQSVLKTFKQLHDRYSTAVVPMTNGTCSGCGISLPTSMAYEVQVGKEIVQCPRCTRILYYIAESARQLKRILRGTEKPDVGIARFTSSRLVIPQLNAKTRDDALQELVNLMAEEGFIEKPKSLFNAAINREAIVSTAVEHGLAFPHVRGVEGGGLIFSVGLKKQGLKFGAPKNRLTRIIFFIVIPSAASAFYLQLISGLMEAFREKKSRDKLLSSKTQEQMWKNLCSLTKKTFQ